MILNRSKSSIYLVVRLGVNGGTALGALQGLLHLFHLYCQMGFKVPAQSHAGVLGRLPAGKNLIIAQERSLVLGVQDLQRANLKIVESNQTLRHKPSAMLEPETVLSAQFKCLRESPTGETDGQVYIATEPAGRSYQVH